MKRYLYLAVLIGLALILVSCWFTEPIYLLPESWLCSVNADGTGFRKIKKVDLDFGTTGFWDIYMTKDNRIIFYGEKLWISDTDTIRVEQITPDNLTLTHLPSRLSQSPDGSKLYFAADKNIYQLSYPDYQLTQLTHQTTRWLRNPIVSDLGNYITYSSDGFGYPTKETEYMYWLNLINGQSDIIPSPDTLSFNPYYSEIEDYVYYERAGLFRSRLDGSDRTTVDNYGGSGEPYTMFSISNDQRYIVHKSNPTYNNYFVRIFDKVCASGVNIPVKNSPPYELLGRLCKEANIVFYVSPGYPEKLHSYRLDTGEDTILNPNQVNIANTYIIAPTWDGSKVYFYADIEVK
ncbi:MAG TPA: DPP IV N-terminal domain-containing protein [Candidatus Cloacimonas sp.]|jgi:hypothetical protein|nr:DPP IV N-terminal domain-containing protein [Candidatus Cloacimonas sp.]HOQ77887.1 DPP IV N-terminal domain-containing protein [Candidatus Cloacimonas sp.]HPK60461.1 DPP IV N-terminal domain-containing protein [Candidatus Cloacimonas sp.]